MNSNAETPADSIDLVSAAAAALASAPRQGANNPPSARAPASYWRFLPPVIRARLDGRPNLRKILANTGWLFADRVFQMFVGLFVGVWVARYLGPERYGMLNYATAFVALFGAFATLGLDSIVVRDMVSSPASTDEILGTTFALRFCAGIAVVALAVVSVSVMRPGESLTRSLVALLSAATVLHAFDAIDFWFQSQVQSKNSVIARNVAFSLVALVRVALVLRHAPLIAFAWAALLEVALGMAGLVVAYRLKRMSLRRWRATFARARALLTDSWPLMVSGLAIMVYMRIGQVMLGEMAGDQAVGLYSAATRISELWYFVPMAIVSSVFPSLVETKATDEGLYYARLQKLFSAVTGLALLVAVPVTLLSAQLVIALFGRSYAAAAPALSIQIWAGLFVSLGVARSSWIVAEGLTRFSLMATIAGSITSVLLNLLLIPAYGASGAAAALLASQFVAACLSGVFYRKARKIFVMQAKSLVLMGLR